MSKPNRADYRLIQRFMKIQAKRGKKVAPTSEDFDKVNRTFARFKGSWEKVFKGNTQHISLLKKIIKVGIEKELFTKKNTWE